VEEELLVGIEIRLEDEWRGEDSTGNKSGRYSVGCAGCEGLKENSGGHWLP
jgi:hypothetical protein